MKVKLFRTLHILLIGTAFCLPTWAQDWSPAITAASP